VVGRVDQLRSQLTALAHGRRRRGRLTPAVLAAGALVALGCGARADASSADRVPPVDSVARARMDSIVRSQPGYVIDSVLPLEEALRRFRSGITDTPTVLAGGQRSREALVAAFARAVERADSLALRRMSITREEFAFLVYPSSPYTRPPYRQQPEIAWLLLSAAGDKGLRRLVERRAGHAFRLVGHDCPREPETEGENKMWRGCAIRRVRSPGDTAIERLFGAIIERRGRFKFYSFGNEL
jgi:hypothetical protein